ncbi:MAG: sulfurtransferase [Limnobacter sp.]|uniref:sulfurtransferase n=1 Tax=Limnobacter sp. TaxID=2003368 RepID=UPI003919D9C0
MTQALICATDLLALINSGHPLLLADCRFDLMKPSSGQEAWLQGHIPQAHYLNLDTDLSDKSIPLAGRHPVPGEARFTGLMQRLGVNADTWVVAYDAGDMAMAARLWWLCRYYGHTRVSVLDGGLPQWLANGGTVTAAKPEQPPAGQFVAKPQEHLRIRHEELIATNTLLVDSRDGARFRGELEPIDPVAGHIPGAVNAFWKACLNESTGCMKSPAELAEHWTPILDQGKPVTVYCGSGVTACVNLLGMAHAGLDGARLFAGSWSEWCQRGGEVETG